MVVLRKVNGLQSDRRRKGDEAEDGQLAQNLRPQLGADAFVEDVFLEVLRNLLVVDRDADECDD